MEAHGPFLQTQSRQTRPHRAPRQIVINYANNPTGLWVEGGPG